MIKEKLQFVGSKLVSFIRIAIRSSLGIALLAFCLFMAWTSCWFFFRLAGWLHRVLFGQPW